MPEGDSIHNLATRLTPALLGKPVRAFAAHDIADAAAATLVGQHIVGLEARGKNLLIRFDDGRVLHIHLRMLGRVRFERPRSAFYRPRTTSHQLRLEVDGAVVVGDRIPVLRLLAAGQERHAPDLARLGPDLTATATDETDLARAVQRLRGLSTRSIGEALLVQRALSGIGNIYKSETLFVQRIDPRLMVSALSDECLAGLVDTARTLLRQNLRPGARITRPTLAGPRFWVYRRDGRACLRCQGGPIVRILQGAAPGRSTYFCPSCQGPEPA